MQGFARTAPFIALGPYAALALPKAARTPHPTCGASLRDRCRSSPSIALGGAGWYAVSTLTGLVDGARASGSLSTGPQSTPKSAWKAGEVPALYQRDPAWADGTYAEDDFGTTGCGPTCMAMAYVALTGRTDMTPADMGAFSERLGCATPTAPPGRS